jgi:hypothetical protein
MEDFLRKIAGSATPEEFCGYAELCLDDPFLCFIIDRMTAKYNEAVQAAADLKFKTELPTAEADAIKLRCKEIADAVDKLRAKILADLNLLPADASREAITDCVDELFDKFDSEQNFFGD